GNPLALLGLGVNDFGTAKHRLRMAVGLLGIGGGGAFLPGAERDHRPWMVALLAPRGEGEKCRGSSRYRCADNVARTRRRIPRRSSPLSTALQRCWRSPSQASSSIRPSKSAPPLLPDIGQTVCAPLLRLAKTRSVVATTLNAYRRDTATDRAASIEG